MGSPGPEERRRFNRDNARPGRQLPVQLRIGDAPWVAATTRNVGIGGAFLLTDGVLAAPPAVGSELAVELILPGRTHRLGATVRWRGDGGIGVQFLAVDIDVLLDLSEYFDAADVAR